MVSEKPRFCLKLLLRVSSLFVGCLWDLFKRFDKVLDALKDF